MQTELSEITPRDIVDYLRDKLKDQLSTLELTALRESDTYVDVEKRVKAILVDFYNEGDLNEVLPEPPTFKLKEISIADYKYQVVPTNESAKRIIQMLNCQMPHLRR